jgi:hypothetical protein
MKSFCKVVLVFLVAARRQASRNLEKQIALQKKAGNS